MEKVGKYTLGDAATRESDWGPSRRARNIETGAEVVLTRLASVKVPPALARLHTITSPNVIRVVDWFVDGDGLQVATTPLDGPTLAEALDAKLPIAIGPILDGIVAGLRALHALEGVHRRLSPDRVVLVDGLRVPVLVDSALDTTFLGSAYSAPEEPSPNGRVGTWTDVFALGALAYRLYAGRDARGGTSVEVMKSYLTNAFDFSPLDDTVRSTIEQCMTVDLHARPTIDAVRRFPASYAPSDPTEAALIAALRAQPDDGAARQVYADWLETHGDRDRAEFVRTDSAVAGDPDWRALVARPVVDRCLKLSFECPKRWDSLSPTAIDSVRHCADCAKPVFLVRSVSEARRRGTRNQCIAIDAALARGETLSAYDLANQDERPMLMGASIRHVEPEPPKLLDRVKGWFRR
jgi:uncharacterized protein (TIGR02996 family)